MKCRICFLRPPAAVSYLVLYMYLCTFLGEGGPVKCNFLPRLLDEEEEVGQGITTQRASASSL